MARKLSRNRGRRTATILVAAVSTVAGLSQLMTPGAAQGASITWANTNVSFNVGAAWVGGVAPNTTGTGVNADVGVFQGVPSAQPLITVASRVIGALDIQSGGWLFSGSAPANRFSFSTGVDTGAGSFSGINSTNNATGTLQFNCGVNLSNTPVTFNYSLDTTFAGTFESDGTGTARTLTLLGSGNTIMSGNVNLASAVTQINRTFIFNNTGAGTILISGPIITSASSNATFAVDGSSLVEVTNVNNTQVQTRLAGGTLRIHADSNLGATPAAFTANNINVTGTSTLQLAAGVGTVTLGANRGISITGSTSRTMTIDTNDAGNALVVNTAIVESGGGIGNFTKQGAGTLVLNQANSLTGTVNFAGGTMIVAPGALGTGLLRWGGGTLAASAPITVAQNSLLTNLSTIAGGQTITFAGQLQYNGTTDRTERFSQDAGVVTQVNGGMLISASDAPRLFTIGGTGEVAFNSAIGEATGQAGTLRITNDGTVTFNVANTYTGGTILDDVGIDLNIGDNGAFGSGPITWNAGTIRSTSASPRTISNPLTLGAGDTKLISGPADFTFTGPVTLSGGGQRVFSVSTTNTATFTNAVGESDGTGLAKAGAGTLILTGTNTYAGGTNIRNGVLSISSDSNLGAAGTSISFGSSGTLLATAGTLRLAGSISSSARNVVVFEDGGTIDTNGNSFTTSGNASGAGALTKIGAGTVALQNVRTAGLHVNGGTVRITANGTDTGVSQIGSLTISGGRFDMDNNDAVFTGTSRAEIQSLINSGRNGGAWNGLGITSSTAALPIKNKTFGVLVGTEYALLNGGVFDGISINGTDTLVKFTYYGDTDFNGQVNFDDYSRTDSGFNNHRTGWLNGDFDGNGQVDFDDYSLIDNAFNTQTGSLRRAMTYLDGSDRSSKGMNTPALQLVMDHFNQFGQSYASSFLNAVPEPGTLLLGVPVLAGVLMGRNRRRRS